MVQKYCPEHFGSHNIFCLLKTRYTKTLFPKNSKNCIQIRFKVKKNFRWKKFWGQKWIQKKFSLKEISEIWKSTFKHSWNILDKLQAGAELCQAQHSLGLLPLAWNFALVGAAYSASCGWSWKHGWTAA